MAGKRKRCPCVLCHNARLQPGAKRGKRLDADVVAEHVDAWGLPTEYDADSDYMSFSDAGSDDNSTGSPDAAPAAAADEDNAPQASPQAPAPSQPCVGSNARRVRGQQVRAHLRAFSSVNHVAQAFELGQSSPEPRRVGARNGS